MYDSDNLVKEPLMKGWTRVLVIIFPWFMSVGIFQLLGYLLFEELFPEVLSPELLILVYQLLSLVATVLIVAIFRRYVDRASFVSMGFKSKGLDIILGLVLGAVIIGIGFGTLLLLGEIEIANVYFKLDQLLISILLFVLVAFNEEIFLRGYILNNLMQSMNKYLALILSSIFFSFLHFMNPEFGLLPFISLFFAGLLLGMSYIFTKNLCFPIAFHFSWNFAQTIFGFNVSGAVKSPFIDQTRIEDNLINGGEFGFEGSILSIAFTIIAIAIIWWWFKKQVKTDEQTSIISVDE